MNQLLIGKFITKKRKEQNLTQEQLAEKIGVSNKTISKWETGKCMPDYSVIELLCKELNTTLGELMNGEEDEKSIHTYDNEQIVEMLKDIQNLKATKTIIIGYILIIMGGIMLILSQMFSGTNIQDFLSGVMLGLSIGEFITGTFLLAYSFVCKNKKKRGD
ncbi:MAG: helix-turn-helix domain-containing protein [Lachnospiraceae bacterium]|nr:helix-turn-helix domain-containing protein [Lachnospiraceae bacterium]MDE6982763.1 helix-turn-helix domain-containing protein [Lachnospiraceae bacterium]